MGPKAVWVARLKVTEPWVNLPSAVNSAPDSTRCTLTYDTKLSFGQHYGADAGHLTLRPRRDTAAVHNTEECSVRFEM